MPRRHAARAPEPGAPLRLPWLSELAAGYLTAFPKLAAERRRGRRGFLFTTGRGRERAGVFVGFLTGPSPDCAVFAFVEPARGRLHERLVRRSGSLFRETYDLVTKYTARPPRFELREEQGAALVRRAPVASFPAGERDKHARNFFMETLALLQRTGLPEKLARALD